MDLADRLVNTGYLGRELLTWLWFKSDKQQGLIDPGDGQGAIEVSIVDRVTLAGLGQGADRVAVKAEDPGSTAEARMALKEGKKVEQAMLRIVRDQREWRANVKGDTLGLSGIKIPALLTREEDDRAQERLVLIDLLDGLIAGLFSTFMVVRADPELWTAELAAMRAWVLGFDEPDTGEIPD